MSDLFKQVALQEINRQNEAIAFAHRILGRRNIDRLIGESRVEAHVTGKDFSTVLRAKASAEALR